MGVPRTLEGDGTATLHEHKIVLAKHGGPCKLPPPGVFNWHYLQCVLKRFGTNDYKNFPNVRYYELPFKTIDDSDEEYDSDDEIDPPPYPSYGFDRYMSQQAEHLRLVKRSSFVAAWRGEIASQDQ